MHNLHTEDNSCANRNKNYKYVSRHNPKETRFFSSATQVKPCQAGLGTGWVTHCEYRREFPYFALSFLLLLFCILCGVIFKSVLKSIVSIISVAVFIKNKQTNTEVPLGSSRNGCVTNQQKAAKETCSREKYYKLTSGRSTELKL